MNNQRRIGSGLASVSNILLKGMTWDHPRGYDPLVACSAVWKQKTNVSIEWVKRSLQDFESYPVEDLARNYDLIIVDHPHVGQVAREGCLLPLDVGARNAEYRELKEATVGPSFESYNWNGRQWALPVDAAAAAQAYRPDILPSPLTRWDEVVTLARDGRVLLPLKPPHNLMIFFTLAGNAGSPCAQDEELIGQQSGTRVYELMAEIASLLPKQCYEMDPIAVYDQLSGSDSRFACAPMQMAYVSYSRIGFRPHVLKYSDIPAVGHNGPVGSAMGGTGLVVSSFTRHPEEAIDFTYWIASSEIQKGLYSRSGGQVGHSDAWEDDAVNKETANFYRATRATYDGGWLRPRHDGYMAFQQAASEFINHSISHNSAASLVIDKLNDLYRASFQ